VTSRDLVAAVIDFQTDNVLGVQHLGLDCIDSVKDLCRWRDIMVDLVRGLGCAGGCPIGSMANELSEIDPSRGPGSHGHLPGGRT
jgi:TetR/AcrR family transcriptional regulator, transcriptional repressor for nem operon